MKAFKVWWHCLFRTFSKDRHQHNCLYDATGQTNYRSDWCSCGYKP